MFLPGLKYSKEYKLVCEHKRLYLLVFELIVAWRGESFCAWNSLDVPVISGQ